MTITATGRRSSWADQGRKKIVLALRPAVVESHVFALDIACFFEALAKRRSREIVVGINCRLEVSDHRHRPLLRTRRKRPRRRAAEQRDEVAASDPSLSSDPSGRKGYRRIAPSSVRVRPHTATTSREQVHKNSRSLEFEFFVCSAPTAHVHWWRKFLMDILNTDCPRGP